MEISFSTVTRPLISKIIALQSFFFGRPRIDVDFILNPESLYGQKSLGLSFKQDYPEPIPVPYAIYDFEFHWDYIIRIKNNSSKTAYNLRIEKIDKSPIDYLQKIDDIASLREGENIELKYIIRHRTSKNGEQAKQFLSSFPRHLNQIEIIVSYVNEGRTKFYTRFIATNTTKTNEHLLRKPRLSGF